MERHVIIGTAGHIDHGKTTLIKALTGRDTDRLKEEKARGITIDLGFTWMDLTDGERVGIIDVPGHEKFISNMTAGVVGMDLVLLVIAADEGIMPQTREHLAILRLLGVENILVVLNKCDLVDEEWLEMVEQQICGHCTCFNKIRSWNRRIKKSNPEMCKKAERNVENPCISKTSCGQSIFN